jgi:hypothetical protein
MADVVHRTTKEHLRSVNTGLYPTANWIINPDLTGLYDPATRSYTVPIRHWKITGDVVSTMTAGEIDVDATLLTRAKRQKRRAIDARTNALIAQGVVFATKTMSLSAPAQRMLMKYDQIRSTLTYPIEFNTKDDLDTLSIADAATMRSFLVAAVGAIRGHRDGGTALKSTVRAATTVTAVDAVVDAR